METNENDKIKELISEMVGSCTCMTKTPDPEYHREDCKYAILRKEYDELLKTKIN